VLGVPPMHRHVVSMQFMHSSATGCRPVASLGGGWARARRVRALLSSIAGSGSGCASYRPSYRGRSYASVTERGVPAPAPAREPHAHGTSQHCWQTETSGPPPDGGEEVGARPLASRSHDVISVSTGASALLLMRSSSALQRHARVGASPELSGGQGGAHIRSCRFCASPAFISATCAACPICARRAR